MGKKKMHLIKFGPLKYHVTVCRQTICGEYFWPSWHGTTDREQVTCERCLKMKKLGKPRRANSQ